MKIVINVVLDSTDMFAPVELNDCLSICNWQPFQHPVHLLKNMVAQQAGFRFNGCLEQNLQQVTGF